MSDSFADLWNSTAPAKPAEPPKKLGALSGGSSTANIRKPTNDVFSLLATSSSASSRSVTPSYPRSQSAASSGSNVVQKSASSGGDAFSGLLSGTLASSSASQANMTIAQRAAMADRQRSEQLLQQQKATQQASSTWAGLDSLGKSSLASTTTTSANVTDDDWGFNSVSSSSHTPAKASQHDPKVSVALEDDDWGLNDFVSQPVPAKKAQPAPVRPTPVSQTSSGSLWDLDEFTPASSRRGQKQLPEPSIHRSSTPGEFDFGDREDGLLNDRSDDEDDILGDLSRPIDQVKASKSPSPQPPAPGGPSRPISPPPHVIGQIVEMGFSPQQARIALAATETGIDVQAALETLISNGAASDESTGSRRRARSRESTRDAHQHRDEYEDTLSRRQHRGPPNARDTPSPAGGEGQINLQEQADKLLAQASEIGLSMFTRANALWKQGREKVQQAYEEQRVSKAAAATGSGSRRDTRPRWMQEQSEREDGFDDGWGDPRLENGHMDGHNEVLPTRPTARVRTQSRPKEPEASNGVKTGNLLSDDAPTAYVSPWRRKAIPRNEIQTKSSRATTPVSAPARIPSPVRLVQRRTIPANSSALKASTQHKTAGTEMFKLGRYAEAESSYSSAISALPDSHLLLVPLYNNRALTRIKTGDHSGAIEDCTTVIALIGTSYHPAREAKVMKEEEGASVDLADGLIKAYRRRAEAYEGKEKWDAARQDWEVIAGAEWSGKVRNEAVRGAGRCRRMISAAGSGDNDTVAPSRPVAAPSRPKPKLRPAQRGTTPPSEALNRVREANQAAEAEDQMKHDLKDAVDAKLTVWKGGKETNIRALIASLDTILWPGLGWQKVGMHELISPSQVKIRYTKAISKLHPDKLNVNNTTLEQRMIANAVFGSLNDAWNSFKP